MFPPTKTILAGLAFAVAFGTAGAKAADPDLAGKTMKIVIPFGFGGTYGKYARVFADILPHHLPAPSNDAATTAGVLFCLNGATSPNSRNAAPMAVTIRPRVLVLSSTASHGAAGLQYTRTLPPTGYRRRYCCASTSRSNPACSSPGANSPPS